MEKVNKFENFLKRFFLIAGVLLALYIVNLWNTGSLRNIPYFLKNPKLQVFTIVVLAILLEALPFLLVGALISGVIEVFVPEEKIEKFFPKNKLLSAVAGSFLGIFFPVCSCGNVPVAKRLLKKGVPVPGAISYLLAAPIINPVTILSTGIAFSMSRGIILGRIFLAFLVATACGYIASFFKKDEILKETSESETPACHLAHHSFSKMERVFFHAEFDFLLMGRYLVFGAIIAGLFQTFVSRQAFLTLANSKVTSILLMQVLGMSLSLCSFADAFVASTFTSLPAISKIVFMVAGPMTNLALIILYLGTFKKRFTLRLVASIALLVFILGIIGG